MDGVLCFLGDQAERLWVCGGSVGAGSALGRAGVVGVSNRRGLKSKGAHAWTITHYMRRWGVARRRRGPSAAATYLAYGGGVGGSGGGSATPREKRLISSFYLPLIAR